MNKFPKTFKRKKLYEYLNNVNKDFDRLYFLVCFESKGNSNKTIQVYPVEFIKENSQWVMYETYCFRESKNSTVFGNEYSFEYQLSIPEKIILFEQFTDDSLLNYLMYLKSNKIHDEVTIYQQYGKLIKDYNSNAYYENEKDFSKTLNINDKAIFYGANPRFNIFSKLIGKKIIYYKDLSDSKAEEIYHLILRKIKEEEFEEKMKKQRYNKGYSDQDVWNFNFWFTDIIPKMLKELADNHNGYPSEFDREYFKKHKNELYTNKYREWISYSVDKEHLKQKKKASRICNKEWTDVLNKLSFLAKEMDEQTCSMRKKYDILLQEWADVGDEFEKKYGHFGDKLKSEAELKEEKDSGLYTWKTATDLPKNDPLRKLYEKKFKALNEYERKMFKYRNECKNEFFDLMKKYFWNLWD